jgi:multidrug efflux pump subunit AcrB
MGSFLPILVLVGGQFWPPLAVVLAGGVGGSTLLAWTFTPAAYALLSKWRELRRTKTQTAPAAEINPLMAAV